MSTVRSIAICVVAVVGISACSSDDDAASTTTGSTAATTQPTTTEAAEPAPATTEPAPASTQPAPTTEPAPTTFPPPVSEAGSVQDVISQRDDLSNINAAIVAWLDDSPGREGVLRNARGVTMFLPNNDGFMEDDLIRATADFDAFTIFLSEHLRVGVLTSDQLGDEVATAMGVDYPITDGPAIGGRLILEADIEGTNGVVHIIDGPLAPIG